jgi:hypothetical protein
MGSPTRIWGVNITGLLYATEGAVPQPVRLRLARTSLLRRQTLKPLIYSSLHFRQAKDSNDYQIYGNDVVQQSWNH